LLWKGTIKDEMGSMRRSEYNVRVTSPSREPYVPSAQAEDFHAKHLAQAWADQQASTDAFDNNLLTFSSAALGLSVAFIKDVIPLESAEWLKTLYFSWAAFGGCIVITIASFQISAQAQRVHSTALTDYYLKGDETAIGRRSGWSRALPWCSVIGSLLLFLGIASTLFFASKNVSHYKEMKSWQTTIKARK
jgi:hypothetical protein